MKKVVLAFLTCTLFTLFSFADDKDQELHRAQSVLKNLESYITKVPTKSLLQMFYTDVNSDTINPVGSMYFIMREGNKIIQKELAKRIQKDKAILKKHLKDNRQLFTGYNGPHITVGKVCFDLLKTEKE